MGEFKMAVSVFTMLVAASTAASFQHYEIGMPLEAARAVEIPNGNYGRIDFACTGDVNAPRFLEITEAEKAVGITKCWPVQNIGSSVTRASLAVGGDVSATVEFHFSGNRLYEIETFYDAADRATLEQGLRAKFGPPSGKTDGSVQNLYGAKFEQSLLTWDLGESQVTLLSPALNLERMLVSYRNKKISIQISEQVKAHETGQLAL